MLLSSFFAPLVLITWLEFQPSPLFPAVPLPTNGFRPLFVLFASQYHGMQRTETGGPPFLFWFLASEFCDSSFFFFYYLTLVGRHFCRLCPCAGLSGLSLPPCSVETLLVLCKTSMWDCSFTASMINRLISPASFAMLPQPIVETLECLHAQ